MAITDVGSAGRVAQSFNDTGIATYYKINRVLYF